jgi:hypothetical protein
MKRLTNSSNRKSLEDNFQALTSKINEEIRLQNEFRSAWGQAEMAIVVQARGWGDMVPTKGQFPRQPQGSTSLGFALYAATWYDKKKLGYYDYVSGGRGGDAIEGGGLAMGGGMCGGRFDGGNCSTSSPKPNYSAPGCGGSG